MLLMQRGLTSIALSGYYRMPGPAPQNLCQVRNGFCLRWLSFQGQHDGRV